MELQGINLNAVFKPTDEPSDDISIKKDLDGQTPSQRQRKIIYAIWKHYHELNKTEDPFSIFYEKMMNKIAEGLKSKWLD